MAPRKRKVEEGGGDNGKSKTTALSTRVTRSMAHGSSSGPAAVAKVASKKQTGKATKKNKAKETNKEAEEEEDPRAEVGPTQDEEEKGEVEHEEEEEEKKTVVVEHCKQCNSFKTRALQVKGGLEKAVPGVNVLLNPDKPRRGCFEIREEGGEKFISLLDMKRPFKQMKDLDMEEVIAEIVDKIKA